MKYLLLTLGVVAFLGAGCTATTTTPPPTTTNLGNLAEKSDLIVVNQPYPHPYPNGIVASPLTITGEARGTWYFEASFPVEMQDVDGNVLGQGHAEAIGNWMTEDFVPYTATLSFTVPAGVTEGVLYLRKDNPSGLPANDDEAHFPVQF